MAPPVRSALSLGRRRRGESVRRGPGGSGTTSSAVAAFLHTPTFNPDGEVFANTDGNAGFTVNSVSGGIVANSVLIPGPTVLAVLGAAAMCGRRRRRG